jgi:hypothetical protein
MAAASYDTAVPPVPTDGPQTVQIEAEEVRA